MQHIESKYAIAPPLMPPRRLILSAMCLALFITNFDGTAMDVALPVVQKSLGANMTGLQWILNAYNLPIASLLLVSGTLGDRYGRKRIFLFGLGLFTIASIICGCATTLPGLIVGRTLQGFGAAALVPLSLTILSATFVEADEKTKAIGIWSAISAFALIAGPGLGGILISTLNWQSIFWLNVPLGLLTWGLAAYAVPADQSQADRNKPQLDWPGLIFSISMLSTFALALSAGGEGQWLSGSVVKLAAASVLSLVGFVVVESLARHPMLPLPLLKNAVFSVATVAQGLVFFASGSLVFLFSLFLQQVQGYSPLQTGLRFLPMNAAIITAAFLSGWLANRFGWRVPVIGGFMLASGAIFTLTSIGVETPYSKLLFGLVLSGFGGGLTIAPLTAQAMAAVPTGLSGIASAVLNVGIQLGGILGISLQGTLLARRLEGAIALQLTEWNVPLALQPEIIQGALENQVRVPVASALSAAEVQIAIQQSFVVGLQAALWVAALALFSGAVLVGMLRRSQFEKIK